MAAKPEPCPKCRDRGRDRRGDNFLRYPDGGGHCFSCGYHEHISRIRRIVEVNNGPKDEGVLPRDFTREVPAAGWTWLLQWGLPYSYWKHYTGYSPSTERLILTHGNPIELSVGRYLGADKGQPKWRQWGDKLRSATILEPKGDCSYEGVVIVEDLISAHKVGQIARCLPIFGTSLYPKAIASLRALKRPVSLWLDEDQWEVLPKKINRLQAFLDVPVRFVKTGKDPKAYSLDEIKGILK